MRTSEFKPMVVAVLGAGNGGQAIAAHMASMGHSVRLYDRNHARAEKLNAIRTLRLEGALNLTGEIQFATDNLADAVKGADLIMVATTATAHASLASRLASLIEDGQTIILNPGRTCGAIEFRRILSQKAPLKKAYIAEAQTLVYACRAKEDGLVNVIGVKDKVLLAAFPASDTSAVLKTIGPSYPCFLPADNVLQTSFENIGAVFHPAVVLFNASTIERGQSFYFYRDMTAGLARLIEGIDAERLAVAKAYGITPISAFEWVSYAYDGVPGNTLCERMQNNPAYYEILAPESIYCRQITEDIPTGIIPLAELGHAANVPTPLLDSLIALCSALLATDFRKEGRTLENLGLSGLTKDEILDTLK